MKPFILILFYFLGLSYSIAQIDLKNIPKGTTKIIVKNDKSAIINYQFSLTKLLDNDFVIDQKDSELHTIKTHLKPIDKSPVNYYLNIRCTDNEIWISGLFYSGLSMNLDMVKIEDSLEKITNKGMKGSIYKDTFTEMLEFSKLIGEDLNFEQ